MKRCPLCGELPLAVLAEVATPAFRVFWQIALETREDFTDRVLK
jgi:hypothetical protein